MAHKKIKIYTISTCGHCNATKRLLNENHVEYEFIDVDMLKGPEREGVIEEVRKVNSRLSFPTILIEDIIIIGYREDEIREALEL